MILRRYFPLHHMGKQNTLEPWSEKHWKGLLAGDDWGIMTFGGFTSWGYAIYNGNVLTLKYKAFEHSLIPKLHINGWSSGKTMRVPYCKDNFCPTVIFFICIKLACFVFRSHSHLWRIVGRYVYTGNIQHSANFVLCVRKKKPEHQKDGFPLTPPLF